MKAMLTSVSWVESCNGGEVKESCCNCVNDKAVELEEDSSAVFSSFFCAAKANNFSFAETAKRLSLLNVPELAAASTSLLSSLARAALMTLSKGLDELVEEESILEWDSD